MALVYSASTGTYVDPSSGAVYHDAAGSIPSTDPGLTDQSRRSLGLSNQLFQQLAQYGADYRQAQAGQSQLGAYLQRVMNGTAPSVAATQLSQGLDQTKAGLNSAVAGTTGPNAALAAYGGQQAYADAAAKANQAAAVQRAQEQQAAVAARGTLLGEQATEANQAAGTATSGAVGLTNAAAGPAQTQADIDAKNKAMWLQFLGNAVNAGGAAAVKSAAG